MVYIVLKDVEDSFGEEAELIKEINEVISIEIGNIAKADTIVVVSGLPKTRSGKVMRRILRSLAKGEPITQDISTLEDPTIVTKIEKVING